MLFFMIYSILFYIMNLVQYYTQFIIYKQVKVAFLNCNFYFMDNKNATSCVVNIYS